MWSARATRNQWFQPASYPGHLTGVGWVWTRSKSKLWTKAKLLFIVLYAFVGQQLKLQNVFAHPQIYFDLKKNIPQCKFKCSKHRAVFKVSMNRQKSCRFSWRNILVHNKTCCFPWAYLLWAHVFFKHDRTNKTTFYWHKINNVHLLSMSAFIGRLFRPNGLRRWYFIPDQSSADSIIMK